MLSANKNTPSFVIDSNNRLDGDIEEFTFKISMDTATNYNKVSLIHCGIPKYYYNIDSLNNQFILDENGTTTTCTLTPGEYTMENFALNVKDVLDAASATIDATHPWEYNITFNTLTYKWTWEITDDPNRTFSSASINIIDDQCYSLFGFDEESDNAFTAKSLTSTYPACFERTNYITIRSNIAHNNGNDDPDSQILARVPIKNTDYGELVTYDVQQVFDASRDLVSNKTNIFTFSIWDDHNRLMNLQGQDWFFTFMIWEHNEADKLHKEEIMYQREQRKLAKQRERIEQELRVQRDIQLERLDPNLQTSVYLPPEPEPERK